MKERSLVKIQANSHKLSGIFAIGFGRTHRPVERDSSQDREGKAAKKSGAVFDILCGHLLGAFSFQTREGEREGERAQAAH